jgi:Na+-transporting methylmalonyl-CoA/oxaloacetate decarboxylase gamma subunit
VIEHLASRPPVDLAVAAFLILAAVIAAALTHHRQESP